jgi:hypothetical protein
MVFEGFGPLMYEIDGEVRYAMKIEIEVCKNAVTLKGSKHEHRY